MRKRYRPKRSVLIGSKCKTAVRELWFSQVFTEPACFWWSRAFQGLWGDDHGRLMVKPRVSDISLWRGWEKQAVGVGPKPRVRTAAGSHACTHLRACLDSSASSRRLENLQRASRTKRNPWTCISDLVPCKCPSGALSCWAFQSSFAPPVGQTWPSQGWSDNGHERLDGSGPTASQKFEERN